MVARAGSIHPDSQFTRTHCSQLPPKRAIVYVHLLEIELWVAKSKNGISPYNSCWPRRVLKVPLVVNLTCSPFSSQSGGAR